jgi:tripartite-type tricarboxylate transporter receptor subunit TctC
MYKKILLALMFATSTLSFNANAVENFDCGLVVANPAGGLADIYARTLEKLNPNFARVENKVGALSAVAIEFMGRNPNFTLLGSPTMFTVHNTNKNPEVELITMLMGYDLVAVTTKHTTFHEILTGKINIGVPILGAGQHIIALQLKERNPDIQVIATGGDAKALQMLVSKDLDVYISGKGNLSPWTDKFNLETIFEVPSGKSIIRENVTLKNYAAVGMWSHTSATKEQKSKLAKCVKDVMSNPAWPVEAQRMGGVPLYLTEEENKQLLIEYISVLKKYDI